jgi:chromosome segregation ATPase
MDYSFIIDVIGTVGFPIACVIALGAFVFHIYKQTTKENAENMDKVQARCKEREERLYEEIALNREINGKAIETISKYAERLDAIQHDISDIKTDIIEIKAKG